MQTSDISTASRTEVAAPPSQEAGASGSSDFKTFLTLLTAQMRNQDPLKPMDSTEFVAQLASFSSVEQQIETNSKLNELLGMSSDNSTTNLTEWLGKEVRREGAANFDGQPIEVGATIHPSASSARLVVRDNSGEIFFTQPFDPGSGTVTWDGSTQGAGTAPNGRYKFEVESYSDGNLIETNPGSVFDLVTEVRLDHGDIVLIFKDGAALLAENAAAVRMHQT
ncbi:MAG: flagellin biosynthesis protein FlgD [Rhodobacteraceae bacterium]|nr:flagellin biosynthesis protein FlgD [Paracoccaceae bacterium]